MAFLDSLKEKAVDLAQAGATKSKQVAEIVKLKTANLSEEDTIKKAYMELGKLYYAERGEAPEAAYISGCERITAAKAAIEANNARIAELKTEDEDDEPVIVAEATPVEEKPVEETTAEEPKSEQEDIHLTL